MTSVFSQRSVSGRQSRRRRPLIASLALGGIALGALTPAAASAQSDAVALQFDGLEPLGPELVYEGWLIIDGAPQTSGTFNVTAEGTIVPIMQVDVPNAENSTAFVLTLEPADDPDPAPAPTHILGGDFTDGTAALTIDHAMAFGFNFDAAAGSYIVKTPTTETTDDDLSGVWFLDPTGADGPAASLDLPTLTDGWTYEGWVVIDGTPISTGTFLDPAGPDNFSGFSGPLDGPPFPGEDLIVNAPDGLEFPTDVTGATIAISVEPLPDDSPAPFALKPLISTVVDGVAVGEPQAFATGPTNITGTATLAGTPSGQELPATGNETLYIALIAGFLLVGGVGFAWFSRRDDDATPQAVA